MPKPFLLLSAAILFAFAPASYAGPVPQEPAATPAPAAQAPNPGKITPENQEKAKKLYKIDCALCHGETGDGKTDVANDMKLTLADFTDPKSLADKSDKQLFDSIRKGKDKMPPEAEGRASNTEVWNLILYLRSLSKPQ